jgi:hypothetical protein
VGTLHPALTNSTNCAWFTEEKDTFYLTLWSKHYTNVYTRKR